MEHEFLSKLWPCRLFYRRRLGKMGEREKNGAEFDRRDKRQGKRITVSVDRRCYHWWVYVDFDGRAYSSIADDYYTVSETDIPGCITLLPGIHTVSFGYTNGKKYTKSFTITENSRAIILNLKRKFGLMGVYKLVSVRVE